MSSIGRRAGAMREGWLVTPGGRSASHSGPATVFVAGTRTPIFARLPNWSVPVALLTSTPSLPANSTGNAPLRAARG